MRTFRKLAIDAAESWSLNFPAEILTVMNPTRQTVMVRTGSPSPPVDVSDADLMIPPFASMSLPVTGVEFGFRMGEPSAGSDPIGQTYAWLTFTAGEAPPTLGSVAFSQMSIDSEVQITAAPGASLPVDIQNASVEILPAAGSTFGVNIETADLSLPVTSSQVVLYSGLLAKDANTTGTAILPAGTVALALHCDENNQPTEIYLLGENASNAVLSRYVDYNYLPISTPLVVPVSQQDDHIRYYIENRSSIFGNRRYTLTAVVGPAMVVAANLNQHKPFPSRPAYDRVVRHYDRASRGSHAVTERWDYVTPTNHEAIVDNVSLFCDKSTSADQMTVFVTVEDSLGNIVSYAAELWSKTTERQTLSVPLGAILNEGEHLVASTFSSDGSARTLMASAMIREIRKAREN